MEYSWHKSQDIVVWANFKVKAPMQKMGQNQASQQEKSGRYTNATSRKVFR